MPNETSQTQSPESTSKVTGGFPQEGKKPAPIKSQVATADPNPSGLGRGLGAHTPTTPPVPVAPVAPVVENATSKEDRGVFIAFPTYKDTNPATAWMLVAFARSIPKNLSNFDMEFGDAMIYHARNRLVERFLASGNRYILFLDDDMVAPVGIPSITRQQCRLSEADFPDAVLQLHTFTRLSSHGKGIVGASYFTRHKDSVAVNALRQNQAYLNAASTFKDELFEAEWTGTGCLLIDRQVFLDIKREFPELKAKAEGQPFNFFQPIDHEHGEDVSFCLRARQAGHPTFVDARLHALHVGRAVYGTHTAIKNTGTL